MKRAIITAISLAFLCVFQKTYAQEELELKKRAAIVDFQDQTGGASTTVNYNSDGHTYEGTTTSSSSASRRVTDMLTTELTKTNIFQVIERSQLQKVLDEQKLGAKGAITPESAAQAGKVLGVQFIVTGSITEYGERSQSQSKNFIYFQFSKSQLEARVVVDIRVINTTTGEIVMAEQAVGNVSSTAKGNTFKDEHKTDNTLLDQATRIAIDSCVAAIKIGALKIPWEGKIMKLGDDSTSVIMKPGSSSGVKPNMKFVVYSKGESFIDTDTGLPIEGERKKVATIAVVSDVGDGVACKATITSGMGIKAGDVVKLK